MESRVANSFHLLVAALCSNDAKIQLVLLTVRDTSRGVRDPQRLDAEDGLGIGVASVSATS